MARKRKQTSGEDFDWLLAPWDLAVGAWRSAAQALRQDPWARAFAIVLLLAAIVRLIQPDWYGTRMFHPDERWLFDRVGELSYPQAPGRNDGAGLQYGSLPLYAAATVKDVAKAVRPSLPVYDFVRVSARALTGLVDLGTVALTFALGAAALGSAWGLFAALLVAAAPLHIQLAHFFTVDPWMTLFAMATLYASLRLARDGSRTWSVAAGAFFGMALACKSAALPLALPIVLAHLFARPATGQGWTRSLGWRFAPKVAFVIEGLGLAVLSTLVLFFICMPWAVLDWAKFSRNQAEQRNILVVGSPEGTPFVRQYWDTGLGFHIKGIVFFYLGVPTGLLGLLALGWATFNAWAGRAAATVKAKAAPDTAWLLTLLLAAWALPYLLIVGTLSFAKFARYMLPMLPVLALCLAAVLRAALAKWPARSGLLRGLTLLCLISGLGHGLGYSLTYGQTHPWIAASRWLFANVPATVNAPEGPRRTRIYNETWGDDLPVWVDGRDAGAYDNRKVNIVEWDSLRKLDELSRVLSEGDILVMADARAYGTYLRLPTRFPLTHAYYDLLFKDPARLGWERAFESRNPIQVFGLTLEDSRTPAVPRWRWADESFTLYDRPHAFLFRRTREIKAEEAKAVLEAHVRELGLTETWRRGYSPEQNRRLASAGASNDPSAVSEAVPAKLNPNIGTERGPRVALGQPWLAWWLLVAVLGWLALPLSARFFSGFPDGGYALAKPLGLLLFAWLAYALAWAKLLRFHQDKLWMLLGAGALVAALGFWRRRAEATAWLKLRWREIVAVELAFSGAFLLFTVIRAFNPNIHDITGPGYFGGGEPLGMTYLSAVTRASTFPMFDPWLSGADSSYYYFGYVIAGALTKLSGFAPAITYNLSLALFFALAFSSAWGLGLALTRRRLFAFFAAAAVSLAGTLWGLAMIAREVLRGGIGGGFRAWFSHSFIWDPTRFPELVNGQIFEFPFFSYLYGDLHPHNMVLGFSLLAVGLLLAVFQSPRPGLAAFGASWPARILWLLVFGLVLDSQYAINTWSWPVMLGLSLGALAIGPWAGKVFKPEQRARAAAWGLGACVTAIVLGYALMQPFRAYFLQDGGSRLGRVQPSEWQMPVYLPLAYFYLGLLGLGALAAPRLMAWVTAHEKLLGLRALIKRRGWVEGLIDAPGRLWQRMPGRATAWGVGLAILVIAKLWVFTHLGLGGVLALGLLLGLASVLFFSLQGWQDGNEAFLWVLGGFCWLLVAGTEWYFVADRTNTIFKFWFNGFVLLGLVYAAAAARVWAWPVAQTAAPRRKPRLQPETAYMLLGAGGSALLLFTCAYFDALWKDRGGRYELSTLALLLLMGAPALLFVLGQARWRGLAKGAFVGVLGLGLLYPVGAVIARINQTSGWTRPHLDGMAFIKERRPRPGNDAKDYDSDDAVLIDWLNQNAERTEVLLEAPGTELYKGYDRYAIYTGLPTLLGWEYQVGQQLGARAGGILPQRVRDARSLYGSMDDAEARRLLDAYHVRWIVVGGIERKVYSPGSLLKFERLAKAVASSGPSTLYRYEPSEAAAAPGKP